MAKRERLKAAIEASGHTQESLARVLGVEVSTVTRWVGGSTPRPIHRVSLAEALGLDLDRLQEVLDGQGESPVTDDITAALELSRLAGASEVGHGTLDLLAVTFDDLAIEYQQAQPAELLEEVRGHLGYVRKLLQGNKTLAEHQQLLELGGWFSLLAGTLSIDVKANRAAKAQLMTAASLARETGNRTIAAWCLETEAWQVLTEGRYERALELSQAAQEIAPEGSSAAIQATAQEGRARARLGQRKETLAVVNRVQSMARTDPDQPKHHYRYDPSKAMSYTATTLAWVGDAAAERVAREVIASFPMNGEQFTEWPRRLASAKIDLALALLSKGVLDEAADVTLKALLSGRVVPSNRWRAAEVVGVVESAGLPVAGDLREAFNPR